MAVAPNIVTYRAPSRLSEAETGHLIDLYHSVAPDDLLFLPEDVRRGDVMSRVEAGIEDLGGITVLAERDGRIIGHISVRRTQAEWLRHVGEIDLVVSPAARGLGVGKGLLDRAIDLAGKVGFEKLSVDMADEQRPAIGLFERAGFEREGIRRRHAKDREGRYHDLVLMGKFL